MLKYKIFRPKVGMALRKDTLRMDFLTGEFNIKQQTQNLASYTRRPLSHVMWGKMRHGVRRDSEILKKINTGIPLLHHENVGGLFLY